MRLGILLFIISFRVNLFAQTTCECPEYKGGISQFHKLVENSLPLDKSDDSFELTLVFDTFENKHHKLAVEQDSQLFLQETDIKFLEITLTSWDFTSVSKHYFEWREVIVTYSYPSDSLRCKKDQATCVLIAEICEGCGFEDDDYEVDSPEIFELFDVSEMAKFRNGYEDFNQFIDSFLTYPAPGDLCVTGSVNLMFIIEPDGTLSHIEVLGRKIGFGFEEEAIRVLKLTDGMWTPAKQRDKKVRQRRRLPIKFVVFDE